MKFKFNPRVVYTLFSAIAIFAGTILAIQYAQGKYHFTNEGLSKETGLLSANSFPTGAQVYINDRLVSATDDTLYLKPGDYQVKIQKEGYHTWEKNLQVEGALVTQTNAQLFPIVPKLTPLTFSGVSNVSPSPDGSKLLFYTNSATIPAKNGLYVLDLSNSLVLFQRDATQIAEDSALLDLENAKFIWSPDSSEIMLITENKEMLLESNKKNNLRLLTDVSFKKKQILSAWEEEIYLRERQFLSKFPDEIIQIATQSAHNVYLSPDKERLIYTADESLTIPEGLIPPVLATNTQPESRNIEANKIYIYDREEDKNFYVGEEATESGNTKLLLANDLYNKSPMNLESSPSAFVNLQATTSAQTADNYGTYYTSLISNTYQWMPDSKHIVVASDDKINIKTYDNTNDTTVYSGPFTDNFIYPWPDGSKLLILTSFSPETPVNFYAVDLK
ncbi:MAG: PEGA domain-containing protein [Candidatus Pacebacteria bacterium]|nr:PEGA domain-containing protein [Candidatus Paceibacterota bacterium]